MTSREPATRDERRAAFRHDALLYRDDEEYLAGTVPFIEDAVIASEPVMVAVSAERRLLIERALNGEAESVCFVDMRLVGRNPARLIPVWRQFVDQHAAAGRPVRGIGEPVWPGRTSDELDECRRHEELLNYAFEGVPGWWLRCPYDAAGLDDDVLEAAVRIHPHVCEHGHARPGGADAEAAGRQPLAGELPPAPPSAATFTFTGADLASVRAVVSGAVAESLVPRRARDFVLAVDELATNSVRYGGGEGTLLIWREPDAVVCEVRDAGHVTDPLVGRRLPSATQPNGRGLWLANQLCDLLQIRSTEDGTAVRVRMRI